MSNKDSNRSHSFLIKSDVEFQFERSELRDMAYEAYLPELETLNTKRSSMEMTKVGAISLKFTMRSSDITAFRASSSDLISFGKIIEGTQKLAA